MACLGPCPSGKEGQKVTCPKGKSTCPGQGFFSPFDSRSVNRAVSNEEGLKLQVTAHKTFKNKFDQIHAGIKFIYFGYRLQCILTDKQATFDCQLEWVLFFMLQCKPMYFKSMKLANIFYCGTRFIHSLAFDLN